MWILLVLNFAIMGYPTEKDCKAAATASHVKAAVCVPAGQQAVVVGGGAR